MRVRTILNGCPLRINVSLLAIAIICTAISSLLDKETPRTICLVIGWVLIVVAVGPSLLGFAWERATKGKSRRVEDPNTIILGWRQFCQSMDIQKDIKMRVFSNLRNAYANGTTIEIGQPVLDRLDGVSIKAVFAHELAHINRNHSSKKGRLLFAVLLAGVLLSGVLYCFSPLGSSLFTCSALLILIGFMGIAMPFISWPLEYEADLMADQCVKQGALASSLNTIAALRNMDVTRDFYGHPSINKRIANLDCSQKTRSKRWYLKL